MVVRLEKEGPKATGTVGDGNAVLGIPGPKKKTRAAERGAGWMKHPGSRV